LRAPVPASRPALRRPLRAQAVKRAQRHRSHARHGEEPPFDRRARKGRLLFRRGALAWADTAQQNGLRRGLDWRAGGRSISTAKLGFSAAPHTVPGTHAGAVSHPSRVPSTFIRLLPSKGGGPAFSVCPLPDARADLQLLRPRAGLLRRRLCAGSAAPGSARCRYALSGEQARPLRACLARPPLPVPAKKRDASGFTAGAAG